MTTGPLLLFPIRVSACALDPDTLSRTQGSNALHRWSWVQPDYSGFKPGTGTPLTTLWPTLFNTKPGHAKRSREVGVPPPIRENKRGVCVSWSVPAGWSRPLEAKDPSSLPSLPDRWLVVRFARKVRGEGAGEPNVRTWVVDSGVIVDDGATNGAESASVLAKAAGVVAPRRVGVVRTLEEARKALPTEARAKLNVQGSVASPDFTFAAFAPANVNNLSFIDPLDDLLTVTQGSLSDLFQSALTYLVIGWYRDPAADDPLARNGGKDVKPEVHGALGLDPAQVRERRCVFHGAVAHVDYFDLDGYWGPELGAPNAGIANGGEGYVDPTQPMVGFGETAEEALSRLVSRISSEQDESRQLATLIVRFLNALLTDQHWTWDALGSTELEPRAVKGARFHTQQGGTEWAIAPDENPNAATAKKADGAAPEPRFSRITPEHRAALYALNEAQGKADAASWELASTSETLYATWQRLQTETAPGDLRAALIELVKSQQKAVEARRASESQALAEVKTRRDRLQAELEAASDKKLTLKEREAARFSLPKEPAVALQGIGAIVPLRPLSPPRTLEGLATKRKGQPAPADAPWIQSLRVASDDEDLTRAIVGIAREGALVEAAVAEVVRHHTTASRTKSSSLWRRRCLGVNRDLAGAGLSVTTDTKADWPRTDVASVTLQTDRGKKVEPGDVGTVWTRQPWVPLFLDWEVKWFAASDAEGENPLFLKGRTVLAHRPQSVIKSRYDALLKKKDLGASLSQAIQDCRLQIDKIVASDVMAQSLSGLHQQLMGRDDALPRILPAMDDKDFPGIAAQVEPTSLGPVNAESSEFSLARRGSLHIERLWVVDRFGQSFALTSPSLNLPSSALITPGGDRVRVDPRLLEAHRVTVRPRMPDGSSSIVRGWVLPNLLDESLVIYDERCAPLGVIRAQGGRVTWRPARTDSPRDAEALRDPALQRFVKALVQSTDDTKGDKAARFEALKAQVDRALGRTEPAGAQESLSGASLLGRPLALIRTEVGLERRGGRTLNPSWIADADALEDLAKSFDVAARHLISEGDVKAEDVDVAVGSRYLPDDGVIGYFIEGSDDLQETLKTSRGARRLQLTAPLLDASAPKVVDLLLDPRGRIYLEADVLPACVFALSPEWYEDDLRRLPAVLGVAPLLIGARSGLGGAGTRGRIDAPLPAGANPSGGAETSERKGDLGIFSVGSFEVLVGPLGQLAIVDEGEVSAVDGFLIV